MDGTLRIVYRPLKELTPYARNARTHSGEQVAQLVASIEEFGWTNPVLIDENGEIIAGHGRVLAAENIGIVSVPTIRLTGLTDEQKRAYRLADNRLPLNAGWDSDLLKFEVTDLLDADFNLSLTGFTQQEIDDLLVVIEPPGGDDDPYTTKIDSPVYEPSDNVPEDGELYHEEKTKELQSRIKKAGLPADVEKFLLSAAERHMVFDFNKIADYYASAGAEVQALFEESALVIIDYEKAIENGFVHLTKKMAETPYSGRKGGGGSSHTPVEQPDDLLSEARLKILVALSEGEIQGDLTAQEIYLNDTPLANANGTYNFEGVTWEFRTGTQDQEYISGLPEVNNELAVGVVVSESVSWTRQFTNLALDAVRIKLSLPVQYRYKNNGDMVGTVTEYAIDLSTDGGSWQEVVMGKFDGKTTSEYQRDHRINFPKSSTGWSVRVRRLTPDSTDSKLVNAFSVFSFAEVIDSKLRYPNTALLYIEVNASQVCA